MDTATYRVEAEIESEHWWFVGRRELLRDIITRQQVSVQGDALDIGTSTGTNLRLLRSMGFAKVRGLDASADAVRWCREKGLGEVMLGDACALPFDDASFELILATDVIEHVDDDARALREIRRVLHPAGTAIITVPAFQSLWGHQDDVAQHKRRYRMRELLERIGRADLEVVEGFHFNFLLFAPIWLARRLMRLTNTHPASENELNTAWLNRVLLAVFRMDVATARRLRLPFGVSIAAVVRRSRT